jgi:hypothetical protein
LYLSDEHLWKGSLMEAGRTLDYNVLQNGNVLKYKKRDFKNVDVGEICENGHGGQLPDHQGTCIYYLNWDRNNKLKNS